MSAIADLPAFPLPLPAHPDGIGLTKRELFAAMSIIGVAGAIDVTENAKVARCAIAFADALIAELAK